MMRFETLLFVLTVFLCSANAALRAAQIPALAPPENAVQLVAESGPRYLHRDGVLELRGSRGWLRTKGVYLDFKLSFEYRPMTADADTGIVVRSWGGVGAWPQAGYRLRLPRSSDEDASKMLTGRRRDVTVLEQGRIDFNPGDAWQRVVVEASGQRVAVRVNDAPATVYEIESYGGHVFFDTSRGRTEIRNLLLFDTEPPISVPEGTLKIEEDDARYKQPKLAREVKAWYTREAVAAMVQGTVILDLAVLPDGVPVVTAVRKPLHPGLDRSAVAAVRAWRFRPGTVDGKPVTMAVEVQMSFSLR